MITLPTSTVADIFAQAQYIFTDFWPLISLAIGLPVGFWVVRKVISLLPKK